MFVAVILVSLILIVVNFIPGFLITYFIFCKRHKLDEISYIGLFSILFSIPFNFFVAVVLGNFKLIDQKVLFFLYSSLTFAFIVDILYCIISNKYLISKFISRHNKAFSLLNSFIFLIIVIELLYNLKSTLFIHSADMGWHILWSKIIIMNKTLPNYRIIEPFDQAAKFTIYSHVELSFISLLSNIPPHDPIIYDSIMVFYFLIIGYEIYLITKTLTENSTYALFALYVYFGSFLPYGYVQRGNLPDLIGFSVYMGIVFILSSKLNNLYKLLLGLFFTETLLVVHQIGLVAAAALLFIYILWIILNREIFHLFRNSLTILITVLFLLMGFIFFIYSPLATFIDTWRQVTGGNWRSYIVPPGKYIDLFGLQALVLGIIGLCFALIEFRKYYVIIMSFFSMILLSYSPLVGIQLEPYRFLWRVTEILSIFSGVSINVFLKIYKNLTKKHIRYFFFTLLIMFLLSQFPISFRNFSVNEKYYEDHVEIAAYLSHFNLSGYIVVDAGIDNTPTWTQALLGYPFFLYNVPFACNVAPQPYRQVYYDLYLLYTYPCAQNSSLILRKYNIKHIIVAKTYINKFNCSKYLIEHCFNQLCLISPRN